MKWFKWRDTKWGSYTFALCAAVLFMAVLNHLGGIFRGISTFIGFFTPVIYGLILAYIMDFFVKGLENRLRKHMGEKGARILAVILNVLVVILLFTLLFVALIPSLVESITDIVTNWTTYEEQLTTFVQKIATNANSRGAQIDAADINDKLNQVMGKISGYFSANYSTIISKVTSLGSQVFTWVLAFIIAIYFLMAKKDLLKGSKKMYHIIVPENVHQKSSTAFHRINMIFNKYIVCEIVDAFIVGGANAVFMLIAQMPYVPLISVVVGVTNLAPTFGPIAGALIGSFILILVKPTAVIPFLIFTIIIQTIDGYIIKPKFYGGALSVPSVWVLVAIIVLGRMFGVVGILLAIPVAAIITYWLRDMMAKHDERGNVIVDAVVEQDADDSEDLQEATASDEQDGYSICHKKGEREYGDES